MSSPGSQDFRSRLELRCHPTPAILGVQLANWRYWSVSTSIVVKPIFKVSLSLYIYMYICMYACVIHEHTHILLILFPPKTLMCKLC